MRALSTLFFVLAVLLSDVMCAVTAYGYCNLLWGGKYLGFSAPASTAFLYAVPFAAGIAVCVVLAVVLRKRADAGKVKER